MKEVVRASGRIGRGQGDTRARGEGGIQQEGKKQVKRKWVRCKERRGGGFRYGINNQGEQEEGMKGTGGQ